MGEKCCPKRPTATHTICFPVAVDLVWALHDSIEGTIAEPAYINVRTVCKQPPCDVKCNHTLIDHYMSLQSYTLCCVQCLCCDKFTCLFFFTHFQDMDYHIFFTNNSLYTFFRLFQVILHGTQGINYMCT